MLSGRGSGILCGSALWLCGCAATVDAVDGCGTESRLCRYDFSAPLLRRRLPTDLEEVSGLATLGPDGLLAHDDNVSTLWRLRIGRDDTPVRVSSPAAIVDGDFEGVDVAGSTVYLLSSRGVVYRGVLGERIGSLEALPSAVVGRCNFEGIAAAPERVLYLACKYPDDPRPGSIRLYRLEPSEDRVVWDVAALEIDVGDVLSALRLTRLRPSGLAWLEESGRLLVLVGKERLVLDVDPVAGVLVAWRRLPSALHRQAEGIALLGDGRLAVADEGDGRSATLTVYGRR